MPLELTELFLLSPDQLRVRGAMNEQKLVEELRECQKTVEDLEEEKSHLREENHHLRQAAGVFGQLAERLNVTLRNERRKSEDRRRLNRSTPDRRRSDSEHSVNGDR